MPVKHCAVCDDLKDVSEFYKSGRGYSAWCRLCTQAHMAAYRQTEQAKLARRVYLNSKLKGGHFKRTSLEVLADRLFENAKKRSLRFGRDFDLDLSFVREIVREFCKSNHYQIEPRSPFRPSLDRVDHTRSYTRDNVRIIWLIENYARNVFTEEQLIEFCKRKLGLFVDPS